MATFFSSPCKHALILCPSPPASSSLADPSRGIMQWPNVFVSRRAHGAKQSPGRELDFIRPHKFPGQCCIHMRMSASGDSMETWMVSVCPKEGKAKVKKSRPPSFLFAIHRFFWPWAFFPWLFSPVFPLSFFPRLSVSSFAPCPS